MLLREKFWPYTLAWATTYAVIVSLGGIAKIYELQSDISNAIVNAAAMLAIYFVLGVIGATIAFVNIKLLRLLFGRVYALPEAVSITGALIIGFILARLQLGIESSAPLHAGEYPTLTVFACWSSIVGVGIAVPLSSLAAWWFCRKCSTSFSEWRSASI